MPRVINVNSYIKIITASDEFDDNGIKKLADDLSILGHGGWLATDGKTTLPLDSEMYFYESHGTRIDADKSYDIFRGQDVKPVGILRSGEAGRLWNYRIMHDPGDLAAAQKLFVDQLHAREERIGRVQENLLNLYKKFSDKQYPDLATEAQELFEKKCEEKYGGKYRGDDENLSDVRMKFITNYINVETSLLAKGVNELFMAPTKGMRKLIERTPSGIPYIKDMLVIRKPGKNPKTWGNRTMGVPLSYIFETFKEKKIKYRRYHYLVCRWEPLQFAIGGEIRANPTGARTPWGGGY